MDMLMGFVGENVLETKTIYVPAGDGKVNFVLRNEIAEALANVITTPGHENKVYNIGTEKPVSFAEIAEMISNLSGVSVQYVSPEPDEYKEKLMEMGMEKMWAEMLTAFAVAFAANTMNIETTDLTKLLGRKPTDVQTFLKNSISK
jgi:NAD(P)H dehydrogenase (quinone)